MSLIVSYLVIPLVFLMLAVNVYFRVRMIKQYKALTKKQIDVHPKVFFNKKKRASYFDQYHPKHKAELNAFSESLDNLIKFVFIGFVLILLCFCYLYFNR